MVLMMDNKYLIEHINGITRIEFFDKPCYSDAENIIDVIAESYPYDRRLWDFTRIKFDFTIEEIKSIAQYGKTRFIKQNKLAIVAPDNWAYIELHIFQAHRHQKDLSQTRVFRTVKEAENWLLSNK